MTYDFDDGLAIPPRSEPIQPVKTPCLNGPWHGATITHMPDDIRPRAYQRRAYANRPAFYGKYVYLHTNHISTPSRSAGGAVWQWHPFIHA